MPLPDKVVLRILASLPIMAALKFSHLSKQWRRISRSEEFYEMHLKRVKEEDPTPFSLILKKNDPEIERFKIDPFPNRKSNCTCFEFSIQCVIGSCDGIVGMRCKNGEEKYLMVFNPVTQRVRYLYYHHQVNTTSIGMGRKGRVYHFISIDSSTQLNSVYDSQKNSWGEKANSELEFWVNEPTCDIIVDGLPYWRAFGSNGGRDKFIVYTNWEGNNFKRIDYPKIQYPRGDFRSNKLIQFNDRLGLVDFSITTGAELHFEIWTLAGENGRNWIRDYTGSMVSPLHRFWVGPTREVVYQKEEGGASYSDKDNNKKYGNYTPVVLNHVNTLVFF